MHYGAELKDGNRLHVRVPSESDLLNGVSSDKENEETKTIYHHRSKSAEDFAQERRRVMFNLDMQKNSEMNSKVYVDQEAVVRQASPEQQEIIMKQQLAEEKLLAEQNDLLEKKQIIEEERVLHEFLEKERLDQNQNVSSTDLRNEQVQDLSHIAGHRFSAVHSQSFDSAVNGSEKMMFGYIPSYSKIQQRNRQTQG